MSHSFARVIALAFFTMIVACRSTLPTAAVTRAPTPTPPIAPWTSQEETQSLLQPHPPWECTRWFAKDDAEKDEARLVIKVNQLFALAWQTPSGDTEATRDFLRARKLLDDEQWAEATKTFGEIAFSYPESEIGGVSALLYFDGLALIAIPHINKSIETDCVNEIKAQLPKLQALYCEGGKYRRTPQVCYEFYKMEREFAPRGSCNPKPSTEPVEVGYARGAAIHFDWAIRCVELTKAASLSPLQEHCDDDAFYAARAFLRVPDLKRARQARALLLDPNNGMTKSPHIEELEKEWKSAAAALRTRTFGRGSS